MAAIHSIWLYVGRLSRVVLSNPGAAGAGLGVVGTGGAAVVAVGAAIVATPVVVGAGLGLLGFSSTGVVAGSTAAGIQSTIYGGTVASGSVFALCQSFAMGGMAGAAAAAQTVGGALAAGGGMATWFGRRMAAMA